jgi:hypothetical protein
MSGRPSTPSRRIHRVVSVALMLGALFSLALSVVTLTTDAIVPRVEFGGTNSIPYNCPSATYDSCQTWTGQQVNCPPPPGCDGPQLCLPPPCTLNPSTGPVAISFATVAGFCAAGAVVVWRVGGSGRLPRNP